MGAARSGQRYSVGGGPLTTPAARVVPNVPTFPVDQGFWYSIPENVRGTLQVGSIVRVPLGGRRLRGWVVELGRGSEDDLKPITGISGNQPVFNSRLLESLRWAASHYVAPLSVLLAKSAPPNLPKSVAREQPLPTLARGTVLSHPLAAIAEAVAEGRRRPAQAVLGRWQSLEWLPLLSPVLSAGTSILLVTASAAEASSIAKAARSLFGDRVVEVAGGADAELTDAWVKCQAPGQLVIGTPRVAFWSVVSIGLAIVLEEGRRAMKERQTPTVHIRDLMRRRALTEGFTTVFFGPTPSVEVLAAGAETSNVGNRAWPFVEVVDRSQEPPGSGLLSAPVVAALKATNDAGHRSFIHTTHRMIADLIKEADARLGGRFAGMADENPPVMVGTERDMASLRPVSLVIAANPDGMLLGRSYRTSEEALRVLARAANTLASGSGHRMMLQTSDSSSDLVETLRRGDPLPYLQRVLIERSRSGLPPSVEMIAVEVRGAIPEGVAAQLESIDGAGVIGPIELDGAKRWLLQGDLGPARKKLREMATRWRGAGATLRIDADPIDL